MYVHTVVQSLEDMKERENLVLVIVQNEINRQMDFLNHMFGSSIENFKLIVYYIRSLSKLGERMFFCLRKEYWEMSYFLIGFISVFTVLTATDVVLSNLKK